jgi:DNA-binding MarR family transcriptional regulator
MNDRSRAAAAPSGVSYLVGRLHHLLRRRLAEAISPIGLTVPQYTALAILGARGQLSNAQLAERTFITPQTANEMVKTMEERGWIERSPDPSHGRVIHLRLTAEGKTVLDAAHAAVATLEDDMLADVPQRDRQRFQEQLKACVHALTLTSIGAA